MRLGRWIAPGVLALALSVTSPTARAEPGESAARDTSVCLSFAPGPRGCPTAKQTEAAVESILGHRASSASPCDVQVRGEIQQVQEGGWQANLSFAKTGGEALGDRTLQSRAASCSALKDPVSLVIALMVERSASSATLQVPPPEPSTERRSDLSVGLALSSGLLPNLAYGASLEGAVELARWLHVRVGSSFFFPNSTVDAGRGGDFWGWVAGVGVCPKVLGTSALDASICVGGRAGVIHGVGIGMTGFTGSPTKPYGDVETHARLSLPLYGSLAGFAQLGLAIPWLRPRFVYQDAADRPVEVHRPNAVALVAGVGVELRAGAGTRTGATSP